MLDWNSIYKSGKDFGMLPDSVVDMILTYVNPKASKTFLDIGSGTGHLTRLLHDRGYTGLGIDVSGEAIAIAESRADSINYREFDVDQEDVTLLTGPYGLITCKHVYAFIKHKNSFLKNASGLLEENGLFVLLTPLIGKVPNERNNIAVDSEKLRNDVAQYFTIVADRELKSGQMLILSLKN